jgi:hypothetical protein
MNPEAPLDGLNDHWEPPPEEPVLIWPMLLTLFVIVVIGFAVYSCSAGAHDYRHPEKQKWYESLHSSKEVCCDGKEATHIADFEWDTTCEQNNFGEKLCHYRVFLHNKWRDVPASAVVEGPNLDGSALLWEIPDWHGNQITDTTIRCFMPGAGG